MSQKIQVRRGTAAELAAITPAQGELCWTTDNKKYYVGDGTTAGGILVGPATPIALTTLTWSSTVNIDIAKEEQTVSITGNTTFTTSNKSSAKQVNLRIVGDGSTRTFTFPAWISLGAALPSGLAAGKTALLSLKCYGTADTDIIAGYAVQP